MGQLLQSDYIPTISKSSSTQVSMASGARILIGGQQYISTSILYINTGTSGVNGLDTGTIGNNQLLYIYAVVYNYNLALICSLSSTNPSGYTTCKQLGSFRTNGSAGIESIITENTIFSTSVSYTLISNDQLNYIVASGSGTIITVPLAGNNLNRTIIIVRSDASNSQTVRLTSGDKWQWNGSEYSNDLVLTRNNDKLLAIARAANKWDIVQYDSARYFEQNPIINSNHIFNQRGLASSAGYTIIFANYYIDRYTSTFTGITAPTIKYLTTAQPSNLFNSASARITAINSNASSYMFHSQKVEDIIYKNLMGKTTTFSAYVKQDNTGKTWKTYLSYYDGISSYFSPTYHSGGSSWERLYMNISLSDSATTFRPDVTNYNGAHVDIADTNFMETTGWLVNEGSLPLPYKAPDYATELARCQRYFFYWTRTADTSNQYFYLNRYDSTYGYFTSEFKFPVTMRAIPTVHVWGPGSSYPSQIDEVFIAGVDARRAVTAYYTSPDFLHSFDAGAGTVAAVFRHLTASAEL